MIAGARRGTDLGWPTANLRLPEGRVIPPDGCMPLGCSGRAVPGFGGLASEPGRRSGAGERLLEVSILDERLELLRRNNS